MESVIQAALSSGGGPMFVIVVVLLYIQHKERETWLKTVTDTTPTPSLLEAIRDTLKGLCDRFDRLLERSGKG
jgi:hypothetical protein